MSKSTVIVAIFMLLVGLAVGYGLSTFHSPAEPIVQESSTPLFYRNPMDPTITSPIPTKDSMGMDYIPVYADSGQQEVVGTVEIDPVVVQNIGVRTAQAKLESMSRLVRTAGRVDFNEESMIHLHPKVDGWIEEIWVDKTGQAVEHNQMLLRIYSPKLVS
ncbi:MAG TPA: efflux transporter periplasmic adaptor subunit, partial [Gammaproteobacteria bacterium]|nr:efflux transporter periplasmic adaptor subunit [Gammaproteobacteria bacterium]